MAQLEQAPAWHAVATRPVLALADQQLCQPECESLFPDAAGSLEEERAWQGSGVDDSAKAPADILVAVELNDRHARNMARCVTFQTTLHSFDKPQNREATQMAAGQLEGRRIAFLATNGVDESELAQPWESMTTAGARAELVSLQPGEIQSISKGEKAQKFRVDRLVADVSAGDYDALVLPGGLKNPDTLRMNPAAVEFVRSFMEADKPVGSICHGPWLLVEAGCVRGRTLTSYPSLRTDIQNAGGDWVDRAVVSDQKLVTSRTPADLPAFCDALIDSIAHAIEERSLDRTIEGSFPASDPAPGPSTI
jgi:protease I